MPSRGSSVIPFRFAVCTIHLAVSRIVSAFPTVQSKRCSIHIAFHIVDIPPVQIQDFIAIDTLKVKVKVNPLIPYLSTETIRKIGHIITDNRAVLIQIHHTVTIYIYKAEISRLGIAEMGILLKLFLIGENAVLHQQIIAADGFAHFSDIIGMVYATGRDNGSVTGPQSLHLVRIG